MAEVDRERRRVLTGMAAMAGSALAAPTLASAQSAISADGAVRASYPAQKPFLNLDNGCIGPPSFSVQQRVVDSFEFSNLSPCYNMFDVLDRYVPEVKAGLAAIADCKPDELALNRCTTVGMCTAIMGMPMRPGDEVVLGPWDYPSMANAWKQRATRDGIVVRPITYGLMDSDEAIVEAYARAITPKTRAVHLTHMIHWTGRTIPVKEICALARERDIRTVVDGAQSFAHIPMSLREMGCDYFATSFHKWLSGPIGTGMLFVREDRIEDTWPLFPPFEDLPGIDKFGMANLGTYQSGTHVAVGDAVAFHDRIGTERKHARLNELSRYWVERAMEIPGFRIHTPMDHPELGGIATFSLDGVPVEVIEERLRSEFRIQTRRRVPQGLSGIRVSPQIYMRTSELDTFVDAIRAIAASA